jgi:molecular chaperone DnaK
LGTGKHQNIQITNSSGLSVAEIERMRKEAEENADADKDTKEKVEVRNQLDSLIYQWKKQAENQDLSDDLRAAIKKELEQANEALQSENVVKMKEASEKLVKIGELVYKTKPKEKSTKAETVDAEVVDN